MKSFTYQYIYLISFTLFKVSTLNLCFFLFLLLYFFIMTTVNIKYIEFYQHSLNSSFCHQTLNASLQTHTQNYCAISSLIKALLLSAKCKNLNCALDISDQLESKMTTTLKSKEKVALQLEMNKDEIISL